MASRHALYHSRGTVASVHRTSVEWIELAGTERSVIHKATFHSGGMDREWMFDRGATQNGTCIDPTRLARNGCRFTQRWIFLVLVLVEGEKGTVAFFLDGGLGILASHKTERYGPLRW